MSRKAHRPDFAHTVRAFAVAADPVVQSRRLAVTHPYQTIRYPP